MPFAQLCPVSQTVCGCPGRCRKRVLQDNQRRKTIAREHGLTSNRWARLRKQALERDPLCQRCGREATTVHLDPALKGNHNAATLQDLTSLCHRCHGKLDGARGGGSSPSVPTDPSLGIREENRLIW